MLSDMKRKKTANLMNLLAGGSESIRPSLTAGGGGGGMRGVASTLTTKQQRSQEPLPGDPQG